MFNRRDLFWLLAYPVYQTVGTLRHEASHAIAAILQGATVEEFVFWPTPHGWGYVRWSGSTNWLATAAPYICDVVTYTVFFLICTRLRFRRHWVWVNLVVVGLISPLANSTYNYIWGGDVRKLLGILPNGIVHTYFIATLSLYIVGLYLIARRKSKRPQLNRGAG